MNKKPPQIKPEALDDKTFTWIKSVASLMDTRFRVPGTSLRFGLDPLLNLIPFAGNGITVIVSFMLVILMYRYGVSGKVVIKMVGNIAVDGLVGAIPVLGNIFDFYYKSNTRNIQLLSDHYGEGKHQGSAWGIILTALVIIIGLLGLIIYLGIWLFEYFLGLFV